MSINLDPESYNKIKISNEESHSFQAENSHGICKGRKVNKTAACTALTGLTCFALTVVFLPIFAVNYSHEEGGAYYGEPVTTGEVFINISASIISGGVVGAAASGATYGAIKFCQNIDVVKDSLKNVAYACFDLCFPKKDLEITTDKIFINT